LSDNLNLAPLKILIDTISQSRSSGQKEIRISMEKAIQIEKSLTHLLIRLTESQDKIIKLQDNGIVNSLNIELQGEKF